jgi:dolichol-phosphate mannosyltransferase
LPERVEISVVIPVYNEEDNVETLAREISEALAGRAHEMIFVDDASDDATRATLVAMKSHSPALRVLAHRTNAGQSRAIQTGVLAARGPVIATLDGDGQNDPADLIMLYRELTHAEAPHDLAMVMGRRTRRKDTLWKRLGSRLANAIRRRLLRDACDDSGCGIRVIYRDVYLRLPYFDHMHRYMPALVRADGHGVRYIDVDHRPRLSGRSKYTNLGRIRAALSDLRGVVWLARRRRDPSGVDEF